MRRLGLCVVLLLGGCSGSGFWRYERDTFTFPWQNPNSPVSESENFQRARFGTKTGNAAPQLLTEAGDIWPGPPAPVPTLKDLQKQQMAEINNESATPGQGLAPLPTLPSLPGYSISQQDPSRAAPPALFSNSVPLSGGRRATTNYGANPLAVPPPQTPDNGTIIVPNGNGTNTVISPTGQVTTVPAPK